MALRRRLPVLATGGFALVSGLYAALLLLDPPVPAPHVPLERVHGPLMVLGFIWHPGGAGMRGSPRRPVGPARTRLLRCRCC
ncbi:MULTISPECIES: hypothetical protein [Micromonospora]|uniref:hypothetical protein n=1 Tax=Micromonospora TaxID=1873 RepID=UPI001FD4BE6E|nr:hypothetical protein [Micromonospora tulbaghiae]